MISPISELPTYLHAPRYGVSCDSANTTILGLKIFADALCMLYGPAPAGFSALNSLTSLQLDLSLTGTLPATW